MASQAEVQAAVSGALVSQPRTISYPDYKTSEDFPLWLSGYAAKIRNAHGFKLDEDNKVQAEVVRSISGKLSVGSALDAYLRLEDPDKNDYVKLVSKLTAEFVDPHEKRGFEDNMAFNKRKSGQTLKDFKQAIVKDINRYSSIPAKINNSAGLAVDNPEREVQGVKRFRAGMRTREGKKDPSLARFMRMNLMEEKELNWDRALEIAAKWEMGYASGDSGSGEESEESDDEVKAVDVRPKKSKKKKKGKAKCSGDDDVIATLSDKVQENQVKIKQIETSQERMSTQLKEVKESLDCNNGSLQSIEAKLDAGFGQANRGYRPNAFTFQQQPRTQPQQQQPRMPYQQPRQQFQVQRVNQQRGGGNAFRGRPQNFTWSATTQQARQGTYGLQRKTPTSYTPIAQSNSQQNAPTAPSATAAKTAVASMEEAEINADPLFAVDEEEEEQTVTLKLNEFVQLHAQAGLDPDQIQLAAAVDTLNLC